MTKKINKIAIEIALRNKGLSQARLAELLQVSREAVSKWIGGESFPRPDKLLKLGNTLNLKYQELVCEDSTGSPSFAFRFRANVKQTANDEERARHIGELLAQLASCLRHPQFENLPTLKSPSCSTAYVEQVCSSLREDMGLAQDAPISIDILLKKSRSLGIILVPVLWGKKDVRENALRIYLPNSRTTWIYLNLDSASCDFMFWFVHELGHAYAPSLTGEEGEKFADLFAQHLLYPNWRSESLYKQLVRVKNPGIVINKIIENADRLQISPITVYKAIESYCKENSARPLLSSNSPYPAFNNHCLEQETIAEKYFGKSQLDIADYLIKSKEIFGSEFFDALKKLKETQNIPQGFVQQVTQMSLLDAKTLWMGPDKMPQSKVLLDTNAYFRLAPSIHPLLFVPFGEEEYCLYVIDDFEKELKRSQRLKSKFSWAVLPEFIKNREHHITISRKQKKEIEATYDYMWNSFKETGVSPVDVKAISVAYVLNVELISDDIGVQNVAKEYNVHCRSTVNLLHIMFNSKHISMEKVHEIIQFLQYEKDTCASYKTEYELLFAESYPVFKE